MRSYTPLRYPGGKSKLYNMVADIIQNNFTTPPAYIEPFAGGAGLALKLLSKGIVSNIYINDFDYAVYSFWYSVKNNNDSFKKMIEECEISIEERERQKEIYTSAYDNKYTKLEIGFATFYLNRTNRSGIITAGVIGGINQNGNYKMDCRFNKKELLKIVENINEFKDKIHVYNIDGKKFIQEMDKKFMDGTIFYLDPPYVEKGPGLYKNSFDLDEHTKLSNSIKKLKNKWFLTYDKKSIIKELYQNYKMDTLNLTYSVEKKTKGEEYIIYSANLSI